MADEIMKSICIDYFKKNYRMRQFNKLSLNLTVRIIIYFFFFIKNYKTKFIFESSTKLVVVSTFEH